MLGGVVVGGEGNEVREEAVEGRGWVDAVLCR